MHDERAVKVHAPIANAVTSDSTPAPKAVEVPVTSKRMIRLAHLFAVLDVSKATGHRLLAAGKVGPRPIRLTPACVRFDFDEVHAWLSTRRPDGSLHDARTWPAVWEMLQRKRK
jgi:predicted DNA-binding transcriptional regulator AlpA